MYPWGHLAVGYLCYSLVVRLRYRRPPDGLAVLALAVGTQFPDLIDKPLSWTLGILPSGRSFGHSIFFAVGLGLILWYLARQYNRRMEAIAFFGGHLLHVIGDIVPNVVAGQWDRLGMLFWPITPVYQYPGESEQGIIEFLLSIDFASLPPEGIVLMALTATLWFSDGFPGTKILINYTKRTCEMNIK